MRDVDDAMDAMREQLERWQQMVAQARREARREALREALDLFVDIHNGADMAGPPRRVFVNPVEMGAYLTELRARAEEPTPNA